MFPPHVLVPLVPSKFLTDHVISQFRLLVPVAPCWIEAPWLPTVLNILAGIPQHCAVIKDLVINVSVG